MESLNERQAEMKRRMAKPKAIVPKPIPSAPKPYRGTHKEMVISCDGKFTPESNAGDFIDTLIQLCSDPPEYLHPRDAARYLYLLPLLRAATFYDSDISGYRNVADASIMDLCRFHGGLFWWVISFYRGREPVEAHPLMPHFALDAAEFVLAHAHGSYHMPNWKNPTSGWRLKAMVPDLKEGREVFDRSFKADFTNNSGSGRSKGVVPEGGFISGDLQWAKFSILPGDEFYFRISRCFLSEGWNDYTHVTCEDALRPFDLREDFNVYGELSVPEQMPLPEGEEIRFQKFNAEIPARWITHGREFKGEWLPLPWEGKAQ
jgi:hypothetical protein